MLASIIGMTLAAYIDSDLGREHSWRWNDLGGAHLWPNGDLGRARFSHRSAGVKV